MRRMAVVALAAVALAAVAACSGAVPITSATPEVPERLLALHAQGTLLTLDVDGGDVVTLVDGSDRIVLQPTWSPGGERVAWVEVVLAGGPEDVVVVTTRPDGSDRTRTAVPSPPFYLSWDPTGERLILLRNGIVELEAGLIDVTQEDPIEQPLARGQPFYFAWAPDGNEILAHVGVGERLGTISLDGTEDLFAMTPGLFQAPAWRGEQMFWVRDDGSTQALVVSASDGSAAEVLATTEGFLHFVVSPDGERVAFRAADVEAPAVTVGLRAQQASGELVVVEVATGEPTVVDTGNPLAFLWSPDSTKLLFLSTAQLGFTWRVWEGGEVTTYDTFTPSRTFGRDYLPFFDQFAHSIELWSPDSGSFVYAGRRGVGDISQVWLQPLDGPARAVTPGVFAAFIPAS